MSVVLYAVLTVLYIVLYVWLNDKAIQTIPRRVRDLVPPPWTHNDLEKVVNDLEAENDSMEEKKKEQMPPRTGRRYIITGGNGFLGGWIVNLLIQRGEEPKNIRILDVRPPTRKDLKSGKAKEVGFVQVDITDQDSVNAAFDAPWPLHSSGEITVFHTAAIIRFHERHPAFLGLSERVNVQGTQNVINAAKRAGVTVLISTSTGTVTHWRPGSAWMFPWDWPFFNKDQENGRAHNVQILSDQGAGGDDEATRGSYPQKLDEFCTIYSYTKKLGETLVRQADKSPISGDRLLRTGCIRPVNVVYGPGTDVYDMWLGKGKDNVSFGDHSIGNNINVENCVLAHMLYERVLIESNPRYPDIGGQAFSVTDPGPVTTWPDTHRALAYFTARYSKGEAEYGCTKLSPTFVSALAWIFETWYVSRHLMVTSNSSVIRTLGGLVPPVPHTLCPLQESTIGLSTVHPLVDDSRARLPVEKGGLGYVGIVGTMEGIGRCTKAYFENGSLRPEGESSLFFKS